MVHICVRWSCFVEVFWVLKPHNSSAIADTSRQYARAALVAFIPYFAQHTHYTVCVPMCCCTSKAVDSATEDMVMHEFAVPGPDLTKQDREQDCAHGCKQ